MDPVVGSIVVGIVMAGLGYAGHWLQSRACVEAAEIADRAKVVDEYGQLVRDLRGELDRQQVEIGELRTRLQVLEEQNRHLTSKLAALQAASIQEFAESLSSEPAGRR